MSVILNIETSSKNCSVCLSSSGNLVTSFDLEDEAYRHSELLTSSIQNILNENNLDVTDSEGCDTFHFPSLSLKFKS